MKALVLCAGKGTRLLPLTASTPKVMLPLDGAPLINHTLQWLRHHKVRDVAINLHHLPRAITDHVGDGSQLGVRVLYSHEPRLLGTAGALLPLANWLDDTFVVVYGDKFLQADLTALIAAHQASRAMLTIALHHTDQPAGAGIAAMDDTGRITRYEEKPTQPFSEWANAGIYICEPSALAHIPAPPCDWGRDVIPALVAGGGAVYGEPIPGLAMDIGTPERCAQAQAIAAAPGAVFVDRDGTINALRPNHVLTPDDFEFLPGVLDGLGLLAQKTELPIVVWTNQPAIGKGLVDEYEAEALHRWMKERIDFYVGARIAGVYICPHAHRKGCDCRKPAPGMLLQAARELGVNLAKSYVVGDTQFDLRAGWAAGVRHCYLVMTGQEPKVFPDVIGGHRHTVVESLKDAAALICRHEDRK